MRILFLSCIALSWTLNATYTERVTWTECYLGEETRSRDFEILEFDFATSGGRKVYYKKKSDNDTPASWGMTTEEWNKRRRISAAIDKIKRFNDIWSRDSSNPNRISHMVRMDSIFPGPDTWFSFSEHADSKKLMEALKTIIDSRIVVAPCFADPYDCQDFSYNGPLGKMSWENRFDTDTKTLLLHPDFFSQYAQWRQEKLNCLNRESNTPEHCSGFPDYESQEDDDYRRELDPSSLTKRLWTLRVSGVRPDSGLEAKNVPELVWAERERADSDKGNAICLAKGGGWRLPTIWELHSLYQQKRILETDGGCYWSSTTEREDDYWYIHFENGHADYRGGYLQYCYIRCVKSLL